MTPFEDRSELHNGGRIVALGELLVDFVPTKSDMKLCESGTIIKTASGSSGIAACAAQNFSGHSGFIGKIGKDSLSKLCYNVLSEQQVDVSRVVEADDGQIGLAFIEYTSAGRNYQYYRTDSVGSRLDADDLDSAYVASSFAIHYPGMLLELTASMRRACQKAVEIARANGTLVSFDPNIRKEMMKTEGARERLMQAIQNADIIKPTLEEARFITGLEDPLEVISALHKMGPTLVAVSRDKDGAILSCGNEIVWADGIDVAVVDPTGAGDTFSAALVHCVRAGYSLEKSAAFCNCAGTLTTMKRGAIAMALPTLAEVEQLMESGACRTHVQLRESAS